MSTNYQRIKSAIDASSLSAEDKKILTDNFASISDDHLLEIADLFEAKPTWVSTYNDSRKKKLEAFKTGNESLLDEILEEEKKLVKKLMFDAD